jgi:hypothetical protein
MPGGEIEGPSGKAHARRFRRFAINDSASARRRTLQNTREQLPRSMVCKIVVGTHFQADDAIDRPDFARSA